MNLLPEKAPAMPLAPRCQGLTDHEVEEINYDMFQIVFLTAFK
jgi:hypothetical protein